MKCPEFVGLSISNPASPLDAFGEPPPPMVSSEGIIALDITQKFVSAAASRLSAWPIPASPSPRHADHNHCEQTALEPGELVKDGYFTLFESVGALEVCLPRSHLTDIRLTSKD